MLVSNYREILLDNVLVLNRCDIWFQTGLGAYTCQTETGKRDFMRKEIRIFYLIILLLVLKHIDNLEISNL